MLSATGSRLSKDALSWKEAGGAFRAGAGDPEVSVRRQVEAAATGWVLFTTQWSRRLSPRGSIARHAVDVIGWDSGPGGRLEADARQ